MCARPRGRASRAPSPAARSRGRGGTTLCPTGRTPRPAAADLSERPVEVSVLTGIRSHLMNVSVLGPLEASVDGRQVALGAGKPRALLAILALHAGEAVSTERLIEGLWGESPPASATKLVQLYVSQLRKALTTAGDGAAIVTRGHGYELRLAPEEVDAGRFERLVAEGAPREALSLWRGHPLDDIAGEPFAAAEIRRLEELRVSALE